MALTDENGGGIPATMLVSPSNMGGGMPYPVPMYGGGQGGNSGFGDGNGWWIILLFILIAAMGGNWGGNNNGGGMMGAGTPIVINDGNGGSIQRGFDQAAVMAGLNGIQSGISGLSTQLCGCCGDMQMSLCNGFSNTVAAITGAQNAIAQQMYGNTIADLERSFNAQTASTQGMNNIQSQLAQCCCDNRLATNDLKYTIATENCADRAALSDGVRDIIDSQTRGTQVILDKLCALELDGYKRENDNLRTQLNMANLSASQTAQTVSIRDSIIDELRSCPIPSQPVYGSQPIFTCRNNNSCGCGCGMS